MKIRSRLSWVLLGVAAALAPVISAGAALAQAAGGVSGHVGGAGQPLVGVGVTAFSAPCGGDWLQGTQTDVNGDYTLTGVPEGEVYLFTWNDQFFIDQWWGGTSDCMSAAPVSVTADQVTAGRNFSLVLGGNVSGTVTAAGSTPLEGAWVTAFSAACNGDWLQNAQTDADGNYTIRGVPAGPVFVQTSNDLGYINEWWDGVTDCSAATAVTVVAGQASGGRNFSLSPGGSVSGQVVADGGPAIAGVWVNALSAACNGFPVGNAQTDDTGNYTITGLPAGQVYLMTWNDQSYINELWDGVTNCNDASPVTVAVGQETTGKNFSLALGGSVSGNVVAAGGSPLEGISVTAFSGPCGGDWLGGTQTDALGDYTLEGLPAGQVYISTGNEQGYVNEWWDNVTDCNAATPVAVTVGQTAAGKNFTLAPGGSVSGRVTGVGGQSLPGINVNVFSAACGGEFLQSSQTDASGNYTVTGLPAGLVYLQTWNDQGYVNEWWDNVSSCSAATPVTVVVGQTTPGRNFSLAPGGGISGQVVADGGSPLGGVWVTALASRCDFSSSLAGTETDASGNYTIAGLPAGPVYLLTGNDQSYVDEWWNNVTDCSAATAVTVVVGQTATGRNFSLAPGGDVSGQVVADGGTPLAGIRVSAYSGACGGDWLGGTQTDASGDYTLRGLSAGQVYIQTGNDLGYIDEWWDNVTDCNAATPVTVAVGQVSTGKSFSLAPGGGVSGNVAADGGSPLGGVPVTAFAGACGGEWLGGTQTDASGDYTLRGLPAGTVFIVTGNEQGYINEWWDNVTDCNAATGVTVVVGQTTAGKNFSLARGGGVSGRVVADGGQPLAGIMVNVVSAGCGGAFLRNTLTDVSGNYTVTGLPPAAVFVRTWNEQGYVDESWDNATDCNAATAVTVTVGQVRAGVDFSLAPGGSITGLVTDLDGLPLEGVAVRAFSGTCGSGWLQGGQTGADGRYTLPGVRAGQVYVRTWNDQGYVDGWWNGVTDCSAASAVVVAAGQETVDINFSLVSGGTVSGRVTDRASQPLAGVWVSAVLGVCGSGGGLSGGWSDASGNYSIEGLPAGEVYVHAETDAEDSVELWYDGAADCNAATAVTVVSGQVTPDIDIALPDVWTVCAAGCDFDTIPGAIAAAGEGDLILLGPGTWRVNLAVSTTKRFGMKGTGATPRETVLNGDVAAPLGGDGSVVALAAGDGVSSRIWLGNLTLTAGAAPCGGGISLGASGTGDLVVGLFGVVLRLNKATSGGGICAQSSGTSSLLLYLRNVMVTENGATGGGGGLFLSAAGESTLTLDSMNDTVGYNTAAVGGGARFLAAESGQLTATLANDIYSGDVAGAGPEIHLEQTGAGVAAVTASYSDIRSRTVVSGTFTAGPGLRTDTPVFRNPARGDFHLNADSACIDRGTGADAPEADYEGNDRPLGAGTDIGADEYVKTAYTRLTLLGLRGGERILGGQRYDITWGAPATQVKFKVVYSKDRGLTWISLGSSTKRHFSWNVPRPVKTAATYLVKVQGYNKLGKLVATVKSAKPFTVKR